MILLSYNIYDKKSMFDLLSLLLNKKEKEQLKKIE